MLERERVAAEKMLNELWDLVRSYEQKRDWAIKEGDRTGAAILQSCADDVLAVAVNYQSRRAKPE